MASPDPKSPRPAGSESILQRRLTLSDMLDLPSFQSVCAGFAELYRVGIKVYEERGPKLVDVKAAGGELCSQVFESPQGRAMCVRIAARVKDGPLVGGEGAERVVADAPEGLLSVACAAGCRYLVMPIRHEGDVLGRAIFGPFVPEELKDLAPGFGQAMGPGFDLGKAREGLSKMRRAPESALARVMGHFGAVLETLVFAGQKVLLTSQMHIEATRETYREIETKNRELVATNERLRELDRLKSNFLATVSHELRTPLTSIIGYSEMLVQGMAGNLSTEQDEYVRTILEKGESLLALISSILDITQIEAGRIRLAFTACDANDIVKQAITSVLPQAQRKKLRIDLQASPGMSRPSIDREKVRQCVVNLLANSVKFTPEGGLISVSVLPEAPTGMLAPGVHAFAIAVEDSGIGIPADQFDRIFETFYQVDQSSTRQFGGAGIGLTIVKSYVEAHGGALRVESELERFSRFTFALPYVPAVAGVDDDAPF